MTTFALPLKSCLSSAVRNLILQKKTNIRNVSSTAGDEWGLQPASQRGGVPHRSLALAFGKICQANNGPLPLQGQSKPGKWTLPTLGAILAGELLFILQDPAPAPAHLWERIDVSLP
uniref:Uncharacterized protein n=1 Tax=Sus scrofa TaxID=9823 RepID=A0A8D0JT97_PIG